MDDIIKPVRLGLFGPLVLVGLCRSHSLADRDMDLFRSISLQWCDFAAMCSRLPGVVHGLEYGIGMRIADSRETLDYCCGVPLTADLELPEGFACLDLPAMTCAVFRHDAHVSTLRNTVRWILETALPQANLKVSDDERMPQFIERYGTSFSPQTGLGGLDVLIPLKQ